jgi:hypothetical protein
MSVSNLPRDMQIEIVKRFDMDTRVKTGIITTLRIPTSLKSMIETSLTMRIKIGATAITIDFPPFQPSSHSIKYVVGYCPMSRGWFVFDFGAYKTYVLDEKTNMWKDIKDVNK